MQVWTGDGHRNGCSDGHGPDADMDTDGHGNGHRDGHGMDTEMDVVMDTEMDTGMYMGLAWC